LPGTGRPSASSSSGNGRLFAQEVERAEEQRAGSASEERRQGELERARRSTRHASFGGERPRVPDEMQRTEDPDLLLSEAPGPVARTLERPLEAQEPLSTPEPKAGTPTANVPAKAISAPEPAAVASTPHATGPTPIVTATPHSGPALETTLVATPASVDSPALPPASLRATAAKPATPPAEATLESTANPAARAEEIVRQIELHMAPGVKRLTLELAPAELGRISIQLALRAGKIAAIVRGERPEALALLESRAEELGRLFAERGIAADEVRFELGFRAPRAARRSARAFQAPTPVPGPAGRAAGPDSIDTYA
jgi:hypothetical protein